MSEPLVVLDNVAKRFVDTGPPALQAISAQIPRGQIVGLAGPDGAGKTTLIRLIAGLLKPSQGTIRVNGYDSIKNSEQLHEITGYMPQKFGLYEDLTVQQNLNLYADLRGVVGPERKQTFERLLAFTNLSRFTDRLAGRLSGGMKQKLGLACALIKKPELLLLDEPSVGVDPISRRELWKMVHELLDQGISVLWSTAYLDEAERCHSVLLLNNGELLFKGTPKELTERMLDRVYLISDITNNRRQVLSAALRQPNVIDGIIQGSSVRVVVKEQANPSIDLAALSAGPEARVLPTEPHFEDAFIDILGGGPGGWSELAEKTPRSTSAAKYAILTEHLTKKFGAFTAADDITLDIRPGEIFGLLGPNGAGKTTTFKMLCGLLKPTSGQAYVNDVNLRIAPAVAREHIGYMAQKFSLYGSLSVRQNLEFFSGIYNLEGAQQEAMIQEMVDIFDFKSYLNESADLLPLGFKQRLALACAVMHHPQILFLDEPTSGVDPITRREFWTHINGLVEKGVTIMVTTHFMDEAEYCDRIGLVYRSRMIEIGTPTELKAKVKSADNPSPTLEEAFIALVEDYDAQHPL